MIDKPRLSIDVYNQHIREDRSIRWPDEKEEQALLARALFGQEVMRKFDYWIKHFSDFLENSEPKEPFPRKNQAYQRDNYFRKNMQTLAVKQKQAVRDLILEIMTGILFSTLITLDQSHFGKYDLHLMPSNEDTESESISLFDNLPDELHDELNDWIVSFSEFADEVVEFVQHPNGEWFFQPINQYEGTSE